MPGWCLLALKVMVRAADSVPPSLPPFLPFHPSPSRFRGAVGREAASAPCPGPGCREPPWASPSSSGVTCIKASPDAYCVLAWTGGDSNSAWGQIRAGQVGEMDSQPAHRPAMSHAPLRMALSQETQGQSCPWGRRHPRPGCWAGREPDGRVRGVNGLRGSLPSGQCWDSGRLQEPQADKPGLPTLASGAAGGRGQGLSRGLGRAGADQRATGAPAGFPRRPAGAGVASGSLSGGRLGKAGVSGPGAPTN